MSDTAPGPPTKTVNVCGREGGWEGACPAGSAECQSRGRPPTTPAHAASDPLARPALPPPKQVVFDWGIKDINKKVPDCTPSVVHSTSVIPPPAFLDNVYLSSNGLLLAETELGESKVSASNLLRKGVNPADLNFG